MSTPEDQVNVDDLSDAADRNDTGAQLGSALAQLAVPPTSPQQQSYAKKILDQRLSGADTAGEQSLLHDYAANADDARKVLQQARERLMAQKLDPRERSFAIAQAFLSPSPHGIPNQLANYAGVEKDWAQKQREFQQQKTLQDLQLQQQMQQQGSQGLSARLALQQLHERLNAQMATAAFRALGATPHGAAAAQSTFGKIAEDEGLAVGSPAFNQRVHELAQADVADKSARAGVDAAPITGDERRTLASNAGIPADVPDPWAGMSTKARLSGQQVEQRTAEKALAGYSAADAASQAGLRALDEFQSLNAETHTGPELSPIKLGGVHAGLHGVGADAGHGEGWNLNPVSILAGFKPNIQRMDKLSQQLLGLAIPEKGFGRVTNMDMGIFQRGMLGIDKNKQTNDAIAQALRIRLQNDLDRHEFDQNYFQVHGHLRGAEASWNKYLNDNPIFDPNNKHQGEKGTYTLNPNRQRYDEYFRSKNEAAAPAVTDADRADPVNAGLSDEDILAAKRPALQAAHAEGGPVELAEGGQPDDAPPTQGGSSIMDALSALKSGATYKGLKGGENPESPGMNLGLETAGGAATAAALLALAKRAGGARAIPKMILRSPALRAALVGGGAGAMAGAMGSQDSNPTADALTYGTTGAMIGPLARLGAKAPTQGLMGLAERLRGTPPVNAGDRRVIEAISSDNPNWNAAADKLRQDAKLKVPSTLGEAAGPRTAGLAQAALGKDTPESAAYGAQLQARQEGTNTRVQDILNQGLKPSPGPGQFAAQEQTLKDELYKNAAPMYDAAYKQFPAVQSNALLNIMRTPSGRQAWTNAVKLMQDLRLPIGTPDATGMVRSPSLQSLDYFKRALDDMIGKEEGTGMNYQATNQGRALRQMRQQLVQEVDQATTLPNGASPYAEARKQYAGDLEVLDALRKGRDDFPKFTPEELQQAFGNMSFAEKDAFRSGVAEHLFNRVTNTPDAQNPAQRVISTPQLRDKLGALFDTPAQTMKFLDALSRESELFQQSKPLVSAAQRGQAQSVTPSSLLSAARTTMMRPETAGQISQTLSATAGPQAQATIARLRAAAERMQNRNAVGNQVGEAAAAGAAAGITPTPQQQQAPPQ